ncbi:DUF3566 domain-containing protein [Bifidobacterium sp. ESL0763]|uniref:DUF3566 domain-containing protein n=1 Tax=Bifidobacterium sp. ESL0763 TaxID=2983227 RepID=UPI0023FA46A1|nr:DUF3566 domain-containing protein [Bifidobacterium sp. ESL0763]MDF7663130.1 DUF3566 domain-containing protein [Bifidobacterium sp. ESL0763]
MSESPNGNEFERALRPEGEQGEGERGHAAPRVARSAQPTGGASPSAHIGISKRRKPRARRMSLSLTRIDAWSVAKVTFLLSVAAGIIQIVAVALIWALLNVVGVFDQVTQIVSSTGLDAGGFNLASVFSFSTVISTVTIVAIVEVVIATLFAVIVAALYNVISQLVGGVHVTLGDD